MRFRLLLGLLSCWLAGAATAGQSDAAPRIGSKNFTESVLIGELLRADAARRGLAIEHRRALGGSAILWQALLDGAIDAYPEYTGTLTRELLHDLTPPVTAASIQAALQSRGLGMSPSLGFEDRYALGISEALANRLGLHTISDLRAQPQLRYVLSNEFINRADGWQGLRQVYQLGATPRGVDHALAYRALTDGVADVIDVYTTDPEIISDHVRVLEDDRRFFPDYEAVWLYRLDRVASTPLLARSIDDLVGRIPLATMQQLNAQVQIDHRSESAVAEAFLAQLWGSSQTTREPTVSRWRRLAQHTREHLALVGLSMLMAMMLGLPLGIAAARLPRLGRWLLALTVVLQTVPSLAMLVFMIPLFGIGARPTIAALFLYSLLPIVRNTITGLTSIPASLRESAASLGLPWRVRLLRIELPLAAPTLIAGLSTAAVINVGTATAGALIGAGGYGEPILTGIRLNDLPLILEGAVPAALMALAVMGLFQWLERSLTPRGWL